jgi:hypothetical protein
VCAEGLSDCRTSYFAGLEFIGWIFGALFIILGMIAMFVRILRYLESRADDDHPVTVG